MTKWGRRASFNPTKRVKADMVLAVLKGGSIKGFDVVLIQVLEVLAMLKCNTFWTADLTLCNLPQPSPLLMTGPLSG